MTASGRGGPSGQGGARALKVRVKTAAKRSNSSARWLERQLNDPYVHAAKREGWRSRAAFKLIELDDKLKFLKPGARVVDLGAAPGGWTQVAAKRIKTGAGTKAIVAVDILPMDPIPGADILTLDFLAPDSPDKVKDQLNGLADVVMSDMASPATGHKPTDHLRVMALCEMALDFAVEVLAPGGTFLAKVLQGGTERALLDTLKQRFATVRHVKPKASRAESTEIYVIATGFRPPKA